jgi:tetratricopeptide (TPR) repeat protein
VLKRFPTNPTGQLMAGRLYATQKRIDPALKAYDAAAQIAQASEEPLIAAVSLLTGERRFVEARTRVDAWRSAQPKSALGPQMLGELALAQSDLPTAERAFREVLAADKPPMAVYKNLAFVLGARKDPSGAADVMAQGVKAYPDNLEVASTHAEWLLNAGRVDESVAAYEALIKRAPNSDSIANNLATVLTEAKGDPASLKRALDVAKRFEAGSVPGTLDTLAMVHYRMGSFEKSATLMQRAVELAPKDPMLKLHLGMALIKKGDPARGKNLIRQALDSKARLPNEGEAKLMLAQG